MYCMAAFLSSLPQKIPLVSFADVISPNPPPPFAPRMRARNSAQCVISMAYIRVDTLICNYQPC